MDHTSKVWGFRTTIPSFEDQAWPMAGPGGHVPLEIEAAPSTQQPESSNNPAQLTMAVMWASSSPQAAAAGPVPLSQQQKPLTDFDGLDPLHNLGPTDSDIMTLQAEAHDSVIQSEAQDHTNGKRRRDEERTQAHHEASPQQQGQQKRQHQQHQQLLLPPVIVPRRAAPIEWIVISSSSDDEQ